MKRTTIVLVVLLAVVWATGAACTDRTRDQPEIQFEPRVDTGRDTGTRDMPPEVEPDAICNGLSDGASCALEHARGVCFEQRCRFVACESGFGDCDDARGCETNLRTAGDCGACGNVCGDSERCAASPDGAVCTSGITCPTDRFDLDSDPENGCEWEAVWEDARTLVPGDLDIDASGWDGAPVVAGRSQGARISTKLSGTPQPTVWEGPDDTAARAVAIEYSDDRRAVLWSDGLSTTDTEGGAQTFSQLVCEDAGTPRRYVGLVGDLVATQFELARLDDELTPAFGLADYLRAFWPHASASGDPAVAGPAWQFAAEEIVDCAADCLFDTDGSFAVPRECAGVRQCRDPLFDDSACQGCSVDANCPDLRVVDVRATSDRVYLVTARGIVVLSNALQPLARIEVPFDPSTSGGPRFVSARVSATGEGERLTLLHSTGFARSLRVSMDQESVVVEPAAADLGTPVDLEASSIAVDAGILVVVTGDQVRLLAPDDVSGRTAFLTMQSAPGVQGLSPVSAVSTPDGVRVFYVAAGQLFTRLIRRAPTP